MLSIDYSLYQRVRSKYFKPEVPPWLFQISEFRKTVIFFILEIQKCPSSRSLQKQVSNCQQISHNALDGWLRSKISTVNFEIDGFLMTVFFWKLQSYGFKIIIRNFQNKIFGLTPSAFQLIISNNCNRKSFGIFSLIFANIK